MVNYRIIAALAMAFIASAAFAQKKAGDYIESVNNNVDQSRSPRELQYKPEGDYFLCINGKNRFTRALYGSHSDYRIETSDVPIFALYKPKNYRSLRFVLDTDGTKVEIDKAEYCEARYGNGQRQYIVRDKRWGSGATLYIDVMAFSQSEGGIWKFRTEGFSAKKISLTSKVCSIANTKLHRNGDMGADKPGCFEPSPTDEGLVSSSCLLEGNEVYAIADLMEVTLRNADKDVVQLFQGEKTFYESLCSRVSFSTPDPYFNTLGSALVLAADGVWDGETWLHGAIGWRMPLAGWRAGYLGDVLGWNDRAVKHFDAYAASQVTDQPVLYSGAQQDEKLNIARADKKWGTEMYSTGYICRNPNRNNQMHHYDMNLNYVDELLWHFEYDADTAYMKKMWPVLQRHLAWEKMNFDSDNDHLYDAYCCIWASDALYYSDGAVTHSSAYNYRGNLLAAKIARMIGENPEPYQREAEAIRKAMNEKLWVKGKDAYVPTAKDINENGGSYTPAHWVEYQETMGNKRKHPDAALWSVYTPVDCGVGTPEQMYSATRYVTEHIPHISFGDGYKIISTSDWMPYAWSINNVASAEIMHTALAYFEAGNAKEGYELIKSNVMDQMYYGQSPANFGQINYYDAARGECYRDFGDNVGISSRALVQGLFGIVPNALDGKCVIRPGFPLEWDSVEVKTPYLSYKYNKVGNKARLHIEQNFSKPLDIVVRINKGNNYVDYKGNASLVQDVEIAIPSVSETVVDEELAFVDSVSMTEALGLDYSKCQSVKKVKPQDISSLFNSNVDDIFKNEYLSPRPASTTLQIPKQGVGEWCHPQFCPEINDSVFRTLIDKDQITLNGIAFATPKNGNNIVYTSLWDNYPASVTIPVKANKASVAYLLMAGSTNHMQTRLDNALVVANYADGTSDTLRLLPPFNWCPIEQDYYVDGMAFQTINARPLRVCLGKSAIDSVTGRAIPMVSNRLGDMLGISPTEVYGREITGGAAQILAMPLNPQKKIKSLTLTTLANDVVIGLMGVTLGR